MKGPPVVIEARERDGEEPCNSRKTSNGRGGHEVQLECFVLCNWEVLLESGLLVGLESKWRRIVKLLIRNE